MSTVNTGPQAGRGRGPPRPPCGDPCRASAEIPPQKKRSRGRAYKVPAQAAPAILRTQSAQAIQAEAGKERGPQRPRDQRPGFPSTSSPAAPGRPPGFTPLPAPPGSLDPRPPALESFRGLALMPRAPSNVKNIPRSAARKMGAPSARSDRPRAYMARTAPINKGLRCA